MVKLEVWWFKGLVHIVIITKITFTTARIARAPSCIGQSQILILRANVHSNMLVNSHQSNDLVMVPMAAGSYGALILENYYPESHQKYKQ